MGSIGSASDAADRDRLVAELIEFSERLTGELRIRLSSERAALLDGAREIQLTKGYVAVVDQADFEWVNQWAWRVCSHHENANHNYACRTKKLPDGTALVLYMHKEIAGVEDGLVDHIDGDGLNNRRSNLRAATHTQNMRNRRPSKVNRTGYKGVEWDAKGKCWRARIRVDKSRIGLGSFDSKHDAARAYNEAAKRLHGDFARLNVVPDDNQKK